MNTREQLQKMIGNKRVGNDTVITGENYNRMFNRQIHAVPD